MNSERRQRFEQFLSLAWYETLLRFIATFIAKTSELLLAGGLVVSTANFLTDGHVLDNPGAAGAWAWVQALALDSSLGISFYYVLQSLKQRDWVKFALYLVLTGLLTLVAGSITNVDIFSHAIHTTMSSALTKLGFDVGLLSTLRSIAVVGFVLMSRLKDVSFKDLYHAKDGEPSAPSPAPPEPFPVSPVSEMARSTLTIEEVALLYRSLRSDASGAHMLEQGPPALLQESGAQRQVRQVEPAPPRREPSSPAPEQALPPAPRAPQSQVEPRVEPSAVAAGPAAPHSTSARSLGPRREERLEQVYQGLLAERGRVSARALAERAYIHRSTCAAWLKARTGVTPSPVPTVTGPMGQESAEHSQEAEPLAQGDGSPLPEGDVSPGDAAERHAPGDAPGHRQQLKGTDAAQEER